MAGDLPGMRVALIEDRGSHGSLPFKAVDDDAATALAVKREASIGKIEAERNAKEMQRISASEHRSRSPRSAPRNAPGSWDVMISHVQRESQADALLLAQELGKLEGSPRVWLDIFMQDKSSAAMEEAVKNSATFVCILTSGYFESQWCMKELGWAKAAGKVIVSCYPSGVHVGSVLKHAEAPEWLRDIQSLEINKSDPKFLAITIGRIQEMAPALSKRANCSAAEGLQAVTREGWQPPADADQQAFLVNVDQLDKPKSPHAKPISWSLQPMERKVDTVFWMGVHEYWMMGDQPGKKNSSARQARRLDMDRNPFSPLSSARLQYTFDSRTATYELDGGEWVGHLELVKQFSYGGREPQFAYGDMVAVVRSNGETLAGRIESNGSGRPLRDWTAEDVSEWLKIARLDRIHAISDLLKDRPGPILLEVMSLAKGRLDKMDLRQLESALTKCFALELKDPETYLAGKQVLPTLPTIQGLDDLLRSLNLQDKLEAAARWCAKLGATSVDELQEEDYAKRLAEELDLPVLRANRFIKAIKKTL